MGENVEKIENLYFIPPPPPIIVLFIQKKIYSHFSKIILLKACFRFVQNSDYTPKRSN